MHRAESVSCALAVAWLQLVGVMTESILHHVVHAMPLAVLLFPRRSPRVRFTAALAAFAWIFMLSSVTPMIHMSLVEGVLFQPHPPPFVWLAPGMTLICAVWLALNLVLLTEDARRF